MTISKIMYKTVSHSAETLIVEKKSKFYADVMPVESEEEALEFLQFIKKKYPDASHHVYAYIIDENNIFRYSDDGEPGGTAGMPVLDTLRKEGLVDLIVVVTRYFGGTLLGTGGLVHAYGASARSGICEAGIVTRTLCNVIDIKVDYTLVGKIQHKLASDNCILEDTIYESNVTFRVCTKIDDTEKLIEEITDITNAKAECTVAPHTKYVDIK